MSDRLAGVFNRYTFGANSFFAGKLCDDTEFSGTGNTGYVHVMRHGSVTVLSPEHPGLVLDEPALLFYPRPLAHRFAFDRGHREEADLVCASLEWGCTLGNPLAEALPPLVHLRLRDLPALAATLELLFAEAFSDHCGRQVAINRLFEYLLIQLLRQLMDNRQASGGLLAGLADPRLSKAIAAMHDDPRRNWSLEELAHAAAMSRARFAVRFRETVGVTPGDYLAKWRIGLAQSLLKQGKPVGLVAHEVGYGNHTALSRAFKARLNMTPTAWLHEIEKRSA